MINWYGLPTQAAWKAPAASTPSSAWTNEGMTQTVTGPLAPDLLGAVMMQEHLLVDLSGVNVPQSVAGPTGEHFWKLPCESLEVSGGLRFYSLVRRDPHLLPHLPLPQLALPALTPRMTTPPGSPADSPAAAR